MNVRRYEFLKKNGSRSAGLRILVETPAHQGLGLLALIGGEKILQAEGLIGESHGAIAHCCSLEKSVDIRYRFLIGSRLGGQLVTNGARGSNNPARQFFALPVRRAENVLHEEMGMAGENIDLFVGGVARVPEGFIDFAAGLNSL